MALTMAAIFVVDTATRYEVAAAVFYTGVVLTASRELEKKGLIALACVCVLLTILSVALTNHGHWHAGIVNTIISIASIGITTYLILKIEIARAATEVAREQMLRLARVNSLEGLTTSIAHEVNQPLAAMLTSGNACQRWLAMDPPNLEKAQQALDRICSDAERASNIIARVRSLTKKEPPRREPFDLNAAVREVMELSMGEMERSAIALEDRLAPDLPPVLADRVQIQQVFSNLLLNAIDAINATSSSEPLRSVHVSSIQLDTMIELSVQDTGVGLPEDLHQHLFDAFWTTKAEGMGVGLSISRAIIEANDGQIWADAPVARGAIFRFMLPIAQPKGANT